LDYLATHTSLSQIRRGLARSFVNYKKRCTRLAAASDKVYLLLAHGRWSSPGTPASSTTKTGCHDIAEILLKVALNTINHKSIWERSFFQFDNTSCHELNYPPFSEKLIAMDYILCHVCKYTAWIAQSWTIIFEDTKGIIRSRKSKDRQCNSQ
jgi:hypothetical protein